MKVVVIGYGSIGSRHARILAESHEVSVVSRRSIDDFTRYMTLEAALDHTDAEYLVIASATNEHFDCLSEVSRLGFEGSVLVEKPLFEVQRPIPPLRARQVVVGYNLRFHPAVAKLSELVRDSQTIRRIEFFVGQHIADWRPNRSYTSSYSSRLDRGGGILRDLSHELDLARFLLGELTLSACQSGRRGSIDVEGPHEVNVAAHSKNGAEVAITMNCLDRPAQRWIRAELDTESVFVDLLTGQFNMRGHKMTFSVERDATYRAMHASVISGGDWRLASLSDGEAVMGMITDIETLMAEVRL